MKAIDITLLIILFLVIFTGVYFIWLNYPTETQNFEEFQAETSYNLPNQSSQFHPNMRFPDKKISYSISENCTITKESQARRATTFLEGKTSLEFYQVPKNGEIKFTCSDISPPAGERNHFVAGEGGPTLILNATRFSVILRGEIALYREETCQSPQVATHELLHALGFNHSGNSESLMYPITKCNQKIDEEIIEEIKRIYSFPSATDLTILEVEANKSGRYLNFNAKFANHGLIKVQSSKLLIQIQEEKIKEFEVGEIDIGAKKTLTVSNLKIPKNSEKVKFTLQTDQQEITKENNKITLNLK